MSEGREARVSLDAVCCGRSSGNCGLARASRGRRCGGGASRRPGGLCRRPGGGRRVTGARRGNRRGGTPGRDALRRAGAPRRRRPPGGTRPRGRGSGSAGRRRPRRRRRRLGAGPGLEGLRCRLRGPMRLRGGPRDRPPVRTLPRRLLRPAHRCLPLKPRRRLRRLRRPRRDWRRPRRLRRLRRLRRVAGPDSAPRTFGDALQWGPAKLLRRHPPRRCRRRLVPVDLRRQARCLEAVRTPAAVFGVLRVA
mmetsp:Transcript_117695/g.375104  ORF Transcript_117695/g.375104 Transcript_117695/m.375104 type:complete len:250 (-) Transcript_117695:621-1370(-)